MIDLCKCGCGQKVSRKGNKYLLGHNHKGKTYEEIYGKLAEVQKENRRIAVQGIPRPDVLGEKNPAKRLEVRKKIKTGVKRSWEINPTSRVSEESLKKIRKTNEKKGTWVREEQLTNFELYNRRVQRHTTISLKEKYKIKDLENIGRGKNDDTIDHIFSVQKGFINGILPQIIGSQINLRIITKSENSKKHTKCGMSINELFKQYDKEVFL